MTTYAIIETGGKQYRVEEGSSLLVDRLHEDEGAKISLRALMLRTDDDIVLTAKDLEKVKVEAKVAAHERGEKIKVFKYKAKKGYRKRQGHRSELTRLEVTEVKQLTRKPAASKPAKADAAAEAKPKAEVEAKPKAEVEAKPKAPAKKPAAETAAKKAPAKKPAAKKPAAKKPAAKKPAAKKPAAKKPAAKKPAAKKPAAKKPAAKKTDTEKEG
ncbi:MAG: 50S ribosomal protein L21 [Solirubrobacterales bacterium]